MRGISVIMKLKAAGSVPLECPDFVAVSGIPRPELDGWMTGPAPPCRHGCRLRTERSAFP